MQYQVTHALGVPRRERDSNRTALRQAQQRHALKLKQIGYPGQVIDPQIEVVESNPMRSVVGCRGVRVSYQQLDRQTVIIAHPHHLSPSSDQI